jgi:hypothetical protein
MKTKSAMVIGIGALTLSLVGCASDDKPIDQEVPGCEGGKCDGPLDVPDSEVAATPCDSVMVDKSGRNHRKVAGRLSDPIANAVLKSGTTCPTTFKEILAKLREADKAKCPNTSQGLATRLISESGQLTGKPSSMRAVVTRQCAERKTHEVFFSLFGLQPTDIELPQRVEFIALDSTAGVFNYYEADGAGKINFFGNSQDMLKGTGAGTGAGQVRRCAGCHTEGGLVMKEFDTPWLHWEGNFDIPGAESFVDKFKGDLGLKEDGPNMEIQVRAGNQLWNASKIKLLKSSSNPRELLKPLFCTLDINLGSGFDAAQVLAGRSLFDSLVSNTSLPINIADYNAQIAANGQVIDGVDGKTDTVFPYTYIMRSKISTDYVNQLISSGIIDLDFAKDVLMIDFTRPIFSKERCDLLATVPATPIDNMNANTIRAAVIQSLGTPASGTPVAELLVSLQNKSDDGAHTARVKIFTDACKALGSKKLVANALTIASLNRSIARDMPILEFQETVASDNLTVPDGTRLNPKTCALTSQFVPTL